MIFKLLNPNAFYHIFMKQSTVLMEFIPAALIVAIVSISVSHKAKLISRSAFLTSSGMNSRIGITIPLTSLDIINSHYLLRTSLTMLSVNCLKESSPLRHFFTFSISLSEKLNPSMRTDASCLLQYIHIIPYNKGRQANLRNQISINDRSKYFYCFQSLLSSFY